MKLPEPSFRFPIGSTTALYVTRANIAELACNVLVSSDNTRLSMTAGVGRAIYGVAGNEALRRVDVRTGEPLLRGATVPLGKVYESPGGQTQAERIFHVAIVDWAGSLQTTPELVRAATSECLRCALEIRATRRKGMMSIALPLMGAGAGGLTFLQSLDAMVAAIHESLAFADLQLDAVICIAPFGPPPSELRSQVRLTLNRLLPVPREASRDMGFAQRRATRRSPRAATASPLGALEEPLYSHALEPLSAALVTTPNPPDDLENVVLRLPAPIATPWFSAVNQSSAGEQFRATIEMGEATVRFLASLAISGGLPDDRESRLAAISEELGPIPTAGRWVEALRTHLPGLRDIDRDVAGLLSEVSGRRTACGQLLLADLPALRNRYLGHGPLLPDDVYAPLLPKIIEPLREFVRGMADAWQHQLLAPVEFDWGNDDSINYVARSLRGPFAVFPTVAFTVNRRLRRRHVFLCRQGANAIRSEAWIDLDPLVTYAVCPQCQRDDVFLFDRRNEHDIQLRAITNGHAITISV